MCRLANWSAARCRWQPCTNRRPFPPIDNPDVLRVAKAGILKDISADVAKIELWSDIYPGPKAAVIGRQQGLRCADRQQ